MEVDLEITSKSGWEAYTMRVDFFYFAWRLAGADLLTACISQNIHAVGLGTRSIKHILLICNRFSNQRSLILDDLLTIRKSPGNIFGGSYVDRNPHVQITVDTYLYLYLYWTDGESVFIASVMNQQPNGHGSPDRQTICPLLSPYDAVELLMRRFVIIKERKIRKILCQSEWMVCTHRIVIFFLGNFFLV